MSKAEGKDKKLPEWSIFDRLDEVEGIALELMDKTDKAEPVANRITLASKDATIMAKYGIWAMFITACTQGADPQAGKKLIIKQLEEWGLSEQPLQWLQKALASIVDLAEKQAKKREDNMS